MRRCINFIVLIITLSLIPGSSLQAHDVTVRRFAALTMNLYSGANFNAVFDANSLNNLLQVVPDLFQSVQQTNFPARAKKIADQIQATQPHLIGLQEVALWRTQFPGNGPISPATTVAFDFLQLLKAELAARNLNYKTLAIFNGFDIELTGMFPGGLRDVRFTDRIVVLARNSHHFTFTNIRKGQFENNFTIPGGAFDSIEFPRGWISVDVNLDGRKFRFINTHLDAFSSSVRDAQLQELLDGRANTNLPVVMVGDFNLQQGGLGSAYGSIIQENFKDVWNVANPGVFGPTCCQNAALNNSNSQLAARIDYVFVRGAINVRGASRLNENPADRTPGGLWPSDHAGVLARLRR